MMAEPARRVFRRVAMMVISVMLALAGAAPVLAQGLFSQPRYAAIVVDAASGEVLYAKRPDDQRYPASISKVMTLYLTFEALSTGRLSLNDRITVSSHANSMIPSKSQLRPGDTLTVDEAIRIVAVHSANDIAVALAERIAGSEPKFAALMTLRAQELGMRNSRFVNASGVPDDRQISSARDIAILCRAVMRDFPQDYHYFGLKTTELRGKEFQNHNHLLRVAGMDGFKTGYTNKAGFNLAASQVRDGRRLITVVLGGSSAAARDDNVETLLDAGFEVMHRRQLGQNITLASIANPEDASGPIDRPSIEQGDGGQQGVQVELAESLRGPQGAPYTAMAHAKPSLRAAIEAQDCAPIVRRAKGRGGHRVVQHNACAQQSVVTAARDCGALKGAKRKSCLRQTPSLAAADPCAHKRGKAKRACDRSVKRTTASLAAPSETVADASTAKMVEAKGGRYLIQVGAYKSRGDAKLQIDRLTKRYGALVGSGQVESGGGNYRARFKGMSAAEAKSACQKLSAKGERCMVMSSS